MLTFHLTIQATAQQMVDKTLPQNLKQKKGDCAGEVSGDGCSFILNVEESPRILAFSSHLESESGSMKIVVTTFAKCTHYLPYIF